jgi:hypothetical protein
MNTKLVAGFEGQGSPAPSCDRRESRVAQASGWVFVRRGLSERHAEATEAPRDIPLFELFALRRQMTGRICQRRSASGTLTLFEPFAHRYARLAGVPEDESQGAHEARTSWIFDMTSKRKNGLPSTLQ